MEGLVLKALLQKKFPRKSTLTTLFSETLSLKSFQMLTHFISRRKRFYFLVRPNSNN